MAKPLTYNEKLQARYRAEALTDNLIVIFSLIVGLVLLSF